MGMPNDLVLIRHGESDGNVATNAAKHGDLSRYTEAFTTTPGSQWRLTDLGRAQAEAAGDWIRTELPLATRAVATDGDVALFDRHYVSPYVRARETAAHLGLPGARWRLNRALRERDWGDIGSMPRTEFENSPLYVENAKLKKADPLYWVAPNGESIAQVAEDRVRNVLDTLHRECDGDAVAIVGHGELIMGFILMLERLTDEEFVSRDRDPAHKIHNCQVVHYTRRDPSGSGDVRGKLAWVRHARPVQVGDGWQMQVEDWRELTFPMFSNADLLEQVGQVPQLYPVLSTV